MPYCPHCRQEYLEAIDQCPECGRLLLPKKPVWRPYDPEEPLSVVRTVYNEPLAYLLKGQLEQEGIPVHVQFEAAGRVYGLTVDGLGANRLMVPESLAAEAEEILQAFEEDGAEVFEELEPDADTRL
ncbi:MAG: DUF2007 domain-containing protein [Chloroflexia bacterium]|nr:DUF2007 domain-containing protein [Chloroflexia bacterium]